MSKKESDKEESNSKDRLTARERDELLINNFVGLQHAMTNMSIRFGALSENINRLLQVFEEAARNIVHPEENKDAELNKEMVRKIDSMLDQNKTIAQGLVAMEEKLRAKLDENRMKETNFDNKVSEFESRVSNLENSRDSYPDLIKEEISRLSDELKRSQASKSESQLNRPKDLKMMLREPFRGPMVSQNESSKDLRQKPKPLPNI